MSGILETILANQEHIKSQLNQIAAALGKTPTETLPSSAAAAMEQVTSTETPPAPDASAAEPKTDNVELDSDGVPWDIRIHSGKNASECKRTKDGAGTWTKRRGVDAETYKTITAELKAKYAGTASNSETSTPPAPSAPGVPSVPGNSAPPAPGAGNATPPPPANDGEVNRKKANEAMHKLTKDIGVNLDVIIMYFEEAYGVDNFSLIPAEKYAELAENMHNWAARLETANGTINWIKRIYEADPSVIEPHINAVVNQFQYVSSGEALQSTTIGEVPENLVSKLNEGLNALLEECRKVTGQ